MKVVFVTGGVLSGIGKGIAAASIGALFEGYGYKVFMQKFDGYLNVDPGTLSPFVHGEVFVTDDGAETDLDLGHYERFVNENLSRLSSFTSGKIFHEVLERERNGFYLGRNVEFVPDVTNLVKEKIKLGMTQAGADISIVEIGGTIGDLENAYIAESARQLRNELGRENVAFVHLVYLPYLQSTQEIKTRAAQHSLRTLMSFGIDPDFLLLRADSEIPEGIAAKIATLAGLAESSIIPTPTVSSIYKVPLHFEKLGLGKNLLARLGLAPKKEDFSTWKSLEANIDASKEPLKIAMVGKYTDLEDAYYSLNEGLKAAGFAHKRKVTLTFVDSEAIEREGTDCLKAFAGICVPGGFGNRGIEGMVLAARFARTNNVPYLGVCLGSQIMAIEFARNVLNIADANSQEFAPEGKNNVVHLMETQKSVTKVGGTMRLWAYDCILKKDTLAQKLYANDSVRERHRHRFEFNNTYRDAMQEAGFVVSGTSPDGSLVEVVEVQNHPFMIGAQFHPEFLSRPAAAHPLFLGFIQASAQGTK